jgi:hypothetical protein
VIRRHRAGRPGPSWSPIILRRSYDVLLAAAHSISSEEILDPSLAAVLAEYVYGYLYIGYETGTESLHLQEITDLPMSGWEVRSLFPEIRDLMTTYRTEPSIESFARTRMPTAIGLAPLIGEVAELLALATTDTDLSNAMLHLGASSDDSRPPQSWRAWLTDLSTDAVRVAAASAFNPEP